MPPKTYFHSNRAGKLLRYYREHYPPFKQKYSRTQFVDLIQAKYAHAVADNLQGVNWSENQLRAKEEGQPPLRTEDFQGLVESGVINPKSPIYREMVQAAIEDWAEDRAYKEKLHQPVEDDPRLVELQEEITRELPDTPQPVPIEEPQKSDTETKILILSTETEPYPITGLMILGLLVLTAGIILVIGGLVVRQSTPGYPSADTAVMLGLGLGMIGLILMWAGKV